MVLHEEEVLPPEGANNVIGSSVTHSLRFHCGGSAIRDCNHQGSPTMGPSPCFPGDAKTSRRGRHLQERFRPSWHHSDRRRPLRALTRPPNSIYQCGPTLWTARRGFSGILDPPPNLGSLTRRGTWKAAEWWVHQLRRLNGRIVWVS